MKLKGGGGGGVGGSGGVGERVLKKKVQVFVYNISKLI